MFVSILIIFNGVVYAQSFNAGFVFQYHVLKKIELNTPTVEGTYSHDLFYVKENKWKAFGAGQSILIGMMAEMDYKKFYAAVELNFNLNTYRYALYYPLSPSSEEKVIFETLYQEMNIPIYVGYQFQSTNLVRYSIFGGMFPSIPLLIQVGFEESNRFNSSFSDRYSINDMRYILYNDDPYLNGMIGFGIHIASLAKVDVRYIKRLNSPGSTYDVKFNTVGLAFTYYLPLHLKKKRFYYEAD